MTSQLALVLDRLEGYRKCGTGYSALCPAHDDRAPSLSVNDGDGKVLLYCHAGCDVDDIVAALGLEMRDLFYPDGHLETIKPFSRLLYGSPSPAMPAAPARATDRSPQRARQDRTHYDAPPPIIVARYVYHDEQGQPLYRVNRTQPKSFRMQRYENGAFVSGLRDVRRVLYDLPRVMQVAAHEGIVLVVEGEKQAHALNNELPAHAVATTSVGGAGKWREEYAVSLQGASHIFILPDNDDPGRRHAADVKASVDRLGIPATVVTLPGLPAKGDVIDFLGAGHTAGDVLTYCQHSTLSLPKP